MTRIPVPEPHHLTGPDKAVYDIFPANLTRALLRISHDVARTYLHFGNALSTNTSLPPKLREMVIMRVGAHTGSAYEHMQHISRAKAEGVSDSELAAIDTGDYHSLDSTAAATLRFVDELIDSPQATTTFDHALARIGEQNLAAVTLLTGHYIMTSSFLRTLDIDLDDQPTAFSAA
ncbi:carboxymuconolactone decarboxylase family protein [Streptomyces sp. NPDC004673]